MSSLRGIFISFALLCCAALGLRAQTPTEEQLSALDAKLDEYVASMTTLSAQEKKGECDFLLSSVSDSLLRNHVAVYLYSKFFSSNLMGDEAVAIHLTDNWFVPGKAHFNDYSELATARIFADFNRQSLLGLQAPPLVFDGKDIMAPSGKLHVLFIYDTSCATCKLETALLEEFFSSYEGPDFEFTAFYAGADAASWEAWKGAHFQSVAKNITVNHFWDPEVETDFQRKYGVLSTPRVFLADGAGKIVGRSLNTTSLKTLLSSYDDKYEYGSDASMATYDSLFSTAETGEPLSCEDVVSMARELRDLTLKSHPALYRHLAGDLLYYLLKHKTAAFQQAVPFVADSLILAHSALWQDSEAEQVLPLARMMKDIALLSPVGSKISAIKVPGKLVSASCKKGKSVTRRLDKLGASYIVFHVPGCNNCEAQLDAMQKLLEADKSKSVKFFLVDFDAIMLQKPDLAGRLLNEFDLSVMPFIIKTDRKGQITDKYVSFTELLEE